MSIVGLDAPDFRTTAEAADAREDEAFGRDKSGEEMPDWIADKKKRAEKIRAAQAEWEAEAKAAAAAEAIPSDQRDASNKRGKLRLTRKRTIATRLSASRHLVPDARGKLTSAAFEDGSARQ